MRFFFADDAKQRRPSRPGMGPLVAIGGISVPAEVIKDLEKEVDSLCDRFGFPSGAEFKWSPGRELWMRRGVIGKKRTEFLVHILELAGRSGAKANIIIEDTTYETATGAENAGADVTRLYLERVSGFLSRMRLDGIVVTDRPSGDRADEDAFLDGCLETLQSGTDYVKPERILLSILSTSSKRVRLIQLADVITGCTLARVAGESCYSLSVFDAIKPLLDSSYGRIGGVGLKIHPDYKFANLYHWLVSDAFFIKGAAVLTLPHRTLPYFLGPDNP